MSTLDSYLAGSNEHDWTIAVTELVPSIHEVDRNAVQIWFRFYPLSLQRFLANSEDLPEAKRGLAMQGDFNLANRIDTSHAFLYGHRFWPEVKEAIKARAAEGGHEESLTAEIRAIAKRVSDKSGVDASLTTAISAVGLSTVAQVGFEAFSAANGSPLKPSGLMKKSPDAIVKARKEDDSQGILGFLKSVDKKFSIIHDERAGLRFEVLNDQEIASGSANDRSQNWQARDERCWEGPVPVECTSASCGTCWVGVIAGAEKLSKVERRERRAVKVFGYNETESDQPIIRLACQAKAYGNATIVIPPWNAVFGKKVYGNVEELELEPATTSAKNLRETIATAASGDE